MPFHFLDHTADIAVRINAPTLDGLFAEAARAFTDAVSVLERVEPRERQGVALQADQPDLLLVEWLSHLLTRFDRDAWLVRSARVAVEVGPERCRLEATLEGEPLDAVRHPIKVLIKAVTYHALEVSRTKDGWQATVVFDI